MSICIAITGKGIPCKNKARKNGNGYCGIHSKEKNIYKEQQRELSIKSFNNVMNKLRAENPDIVVEEYKNTDVGEDINYLCDIDFDIKPLLDCKLNITRRCWMLIGDYLENDHISYSNLALTCKTLYGVLCSDKIWTYNHPLKNQIIHPRILLMPYYRITTAEIPANLDKILLDYRIMSTKQTIRIYDEEYGEPKDELHKKQREGEVVYILLVELMTKMIGSDQFHETIPGGGIMSDITKEFKLEFTEDPGKHKIYKTKTSSWVVIHTSDHKRNNLIKNQFCSKLIGYDGKRLFRFLKT